jgi:energy-coupling factor transporter ATP-binding protein EcfA2
MLERIKSLKTGLKIDLYNPNSQRIYKLDSINLIIGNNGTGKTTLIKSIIRDLTSASSPEEYIAEGTSEPMGIIYYSSAPFHKPMKTVIRENVAFLDASAHQQEKQNFVEAAEEYLATAKLLGLDRNLRSVQTFDLAELSFELAHLMMVVPIRLQQENIVSEELLSAHKNYKYASAEYSRTNRRILAFSNNIRHAAQRNFVVDNDNDDLRDLHWRLEQCAKDVIDAREAISRIYLKETGILNEDRLIDWIATSIMLGGRSGSLDKRQLARRMYKDQLPIQESGPSFERRWLICRKKVEGFIDLIHQTQSGSIKYKKQQIELAINTAKLMKANADPQIIEEAHKLGLLKIGFDTMSSGQAAIMHQMISISQSIQSLRALGKRSILIFIDEGDLLLHLNWQREYISLIDRRLNNFKKGKQKLDFLQVVIASHSPMLASDILRDSITRLEEGTRLPSFGAPIQQIINYSFGTPSIGLVAHGVIESLKNKKVLTDEDVQVAMQIDDDFIREYMLKKARA